MAGAEAVEAVVIGAGVVGLAVARRLAHSGREVVVLEAAGGIGTDISSRNSEVIHAGIYYAAGSLKAALCVDGRERLYRYAVEHGVPHSRCGKLIVATDEAQLAVLDELAGKAAVNGVDDLSFIDRRGIAAMEPALDCVAGLHSPSSGIVDTHAFMLALRGDVEDRGGMVALDTRVIGGEIVADGILLRCGGSDAIDLEAQVVVNAAGLSAPAVARSMSGVPAATVPTPRFAKGNYFKLDARAPFSRLVYPVPEPGGLGVHATLDMGGRVRFGPDVEWVDAVGYAVDPGRAAHFYGRIRRYWPGLRDGTLSPDYCGIRPKIAFGETVHEDFVVSGPAEHGIPGLVNLFGIESPGLTASLALAEMVNGIVSECR